jgi:HlyD family secretion protein
MKAKVKDLNVKAPISGVITDMDLKLGQIVSSGTKIALIEDLSNLFIEANVNQFYSSQLQIGLPVVYEANNKKFTAYIEKINPKLSNDKVYMDLKGEISPDLKSGQNVSCDVIASKLKNVIVIPLGEYLQQTDYQWVFVLNKEKNKAVRKQIKLGKRNLSEVQVLEGLDTTDEIIVSSYQNYLKKDYLIIK